ncbi:protein PFC0760c [Strongylocentrotus purpuratus]|uniref:Uncharacterized protein n=1 Tax=Strongylocentrotus purpuratus TaxID=7668 RepID=A0A7M7LLP8_STRPU|nr:protein PFC0760c [Strongylocentrotus purpuratus]|eukprot:XP_003730756.2 PREDICTED: protein PFC0760c [Strongylocentrotus purpuratus]
MTLGNETRASADDVDSPSFDADGDVASVDLHDNVSSREYSGSNDDEPDLEYLLGSRSGEKEDDSMDTEDVSRGDEGNVDEYDFINFKRGEVVKHDKRVNDDTSTNDNIFNTNSLEDVDYDEVEDDDGESNDDDDGDDDEDGDNDDEENYDKFASVMNPNDRPTEHISANDIQGTPNNPIIGTDMYDHGERLNEVVNDHGDAHGRTSFRDEDAERFLRWLLGYILRRMDDGSDSERTPNSDDKTLSSQDEATATIRRYLANDKREHAKQHRSFREGSLQLKNDGMTQTWNDRLRKGDTEKSRLALEERDEDPGTLLQNIINLKDLERRHQIRDLVARLGKRSEMASHVKSTS